MKKKRQKMCNRKKCPYYNVHDFAKCAHCDWNPDAVWSVKKGRKK